MTIFNILYTHTHVAPFFAPLSGPSDNCRYSLQKGVDLRCGSPKSPSSPSVDHDTPKSYNLLHHDPKNEWKLGDPDKDTSSM